jgi:hypothetical protein
MVAGRLFPKGLGRKNPFLDSGSTLVKASQGNRKGIGIGIDNEEGRIAAGRIETRRPAEMVS